MGWGLLGRWMQGGVLKERFFNVSAERDTWLIISWLRQVTRAGGCGGAGGVIPYRNRERERESFKFNLSSRTCQAEGMRGQSSNHYLPVWHAKTK